MHRFRWMSRNTLWDILSKVNIRKKVEAVDIEDKTRDYWLH